MLNNLHHKVLVFTTSKIFLLEQKITSPLLSPCLKITSSVSESLIFCYLGCNFLSLLPFTGVFDLINSVWRKGRELTGEQERPRAMNSNQNGSTYQMKFALHLGVTWRCTSTMANIMNIVLLLIVLIMLTLKRLSSTPGNTKIQ